MMMKDAESEYLGKLRFLAVEVRKTELMFVLNNINMVQKLHDVDFFLYSAIHPALKQHNEERN
jgi:hypothetical protein